MRSRHRRSYWRFLARALWRTPRRFGRAVGLAINAEHMVRFTEEEVLPRLRASIVEARRTARAPRLRRAVRLPIVGDRAPLQDAAARRD